MRPFHEPLNPKEGYVYVFYAGSGLSDTERRPTKIGFCHYKRGEKPWITVDKRLRDIQRHHWEILLPFHSLYIHDANMIENEIHLKYEKYRIRGEWFNLTYKQICNIKKYLKSIEED
jgi:hypothetical protein